MLLGNHSGHAREAGCDEAGRGCLAGPVVAAAVILPPDFSHAQLTDSKQLLEKDRYLLRDMILKEALAFAIAEVDHATIDKINILQASFLAMHRSLDHISPRPEFILIDGNRFKPYRKIPHACIVKGDGKYFSIAAASILAKTERDDIMKKLHAEFPDYNWKKNKGYPTVDHRDAIRRVGLSPYHRRSFQQLPAQTKLEF
jgi:ribonuclease HII